MGLASPRYPGNIFSPVLPCPPACSVLWKEEGEDRLGNHRHRALEATGKTPSPQRLVEPWHIYCNLCGSRGWPSLGFRASPHQGPHTGSTYTLSAHTHPCTAQGPSSTKLQRLFFSS